MQAKESESMKSGWKHGLAIIYISTRYSLSLREMKQEEDIYMEWMSS
jgi:hypothetical protein